MKFSIFKTLSEGFKIAKQNPIIFVPPLIAGVLSFFLQLNTLNLQVPNFSSILLNIVVNLISVFLYGMTIVMVYHVSTRKRVSLGSAAQIVAKRFIALFLATILMVVVIGVGYMLLIIPGIFLTVKLFFYEFAILIDNPNVIGSLKRSWRVTKGNWWRIGGLLSLMGLTYVPVSILNLVLWVFSPAGPIFITSLLSSLLTAWYTATLTIAYLRLRKR